jgi:ribosomal protein S18 acetylase RimI-like enzyme
MPRGCPFSDLLDPRQRLPQPPGMKLHAEHIVALRRGMPADAAVIAQVHARSWRATYTGLLPDAVMDDVVASQPARIKRWRMWLANPKQRGGSIVAELDGRLVGFVFWGPSEGADAMPDVAEVYAIYLDPDAFGRGIGRSLFERAIGDIVAHGFRATVLWVLDTNTPARRFYEAAGWRPDGATKTEDRPGGRLQEVRYTRTFSASTTAN